MTNVPEASIETPLSKLNRALLPTPLAKPKVKGTPASVVTNPLLVSRRLSDVLSVMTAMDKAASAAMPIGCTKSAEAPRPSTEMKRAAVPAIVDIVPDEMFTWRTSPIAST